MLELVRSASSFINPPSITTTRSGLVVGLAQTTQELDLVQRLRYDTFKSEYGAAFHSNTPGVDSDAFDRWCDHLIVQDLDTDEVIGTYRVLTPENAKRAGGYYSESEFDLSGLGEIRAQLVEFGRACIHESYRQGGALMMLWSGLAEILKRGRHQHVFGCASVSLRDDGVTAAKVWRDVREAVMQPSAIRVTPHNRYPVEQLDSALPAKAPALLVGYQKLGAQICGAPAWDPDFNTADFPMLLSVDNMGARYRRHFGFDL